MVFSIPIRDYFLIWLGVIVLISSFFENIIFPHSLATIKDRLSLLPIVSFVFLYILNASIQFLVLFSTVRMKLPVEWSLKERFYQVLMISLIVILISTILLLIVQIFEDQKYALYFVQFIVIYDITISAAIILILLIKLYNWISRKKNFYELLYVAAFSVLLLTLIIAGVSAFQELRGRSTTVSPYPNPWDNFTSKVNFDPYRNSFLISVGLFWLATSFFLRNYSTNYANRMRKWKYWALVILPLIYLAGTYDYVSSPLRDQLISQFPDFSNVLSLFWTLSRQLGGFFFALVFIFMSKNTENIKLKYNLQLAGLGIMLLFSSIQIATLLILAFPPFGLISLSVMPTSSFLILTGLYYSARSLSYDKKFLVQLRKQIKNESNAFLNTIGSAEWNKNLEVKIQGVLNQIGNNDEVTHFTLEQDDVRNYVIDVINELKKEKKF